MKKLELGYITGIVKGDGCLYFSVYHNKKTGYNYPRYLIVLGVVDEAFAESFKETLISINMNPTYYKQFKKTIGVSVYRVECFSKELFEWLTDIKHDQLKILCENIEFARGFIAGFFNSEGYFRYWYYSRCRRPQPLLAIYNTDLKLLTLIKDILWNTFKIPISEPELRTPKGFSKKIRNREFKTTKNCYALNLRKKAYIESFQQLFSNLIIPSKKEKITEYLNEQKYWDQFPLPWNKGMIKREMRESTP